MPTAGELTIVLEAQDRASAQLRQVGQAVDRLEKQVEGVQRRGGGGLLSGLSMGAGIAAAQQAFGALGGAIDFIRDSVVTLNSELERNVATFEQVTGSAQAAADVVQALRREAAVSPFSDREILDAGRSLISVSERSTESLLELVRVAEVMAAIDPFQGFEGATVALREALAGDFGSFIRRFEASREAIQRFKDQGLSNLQIVRAELERMGYTSALVERLGRTFEGRAATIRSFFDELRQRAGAGLFDRLNDLFGRLVKLIDDFGDHLRVLATGIGSALGAIAEGIGGALLGPLRQLSELFAPGLWDQLVAAMERVPPVLEQQGRAAAGAAAAVEDQTRTLARLGVEAAGLQLESDRVRRTYDDQIRPLERQLQLLQQSADLQRVQNALAGNRSAVEGLRLEREILALRKAAGGQEDPNVAGLTLRQRLIALALQEKTLRQEELGLEDDRRPLIQQLQQQIEGLQEAQRRTLEPLERGLALRKDEVDAINLVRKQEELLAQDVAATAKARLDGWTSQNPGALDEVKKRGEELAQAWLGGWQAELDKNGGDVWKTMGAKLSAWYEETGKPIAVTVGKDLGTAIGDAAATAVGERLKKLQVDVLANPLVAGALGGAAAAAGGALPVLPRVAEGAAAIGDKGVTVDFGAGSIVIGGVNDPGFGERLKAALTDFLNAFILTQAAAAPGPPAGAQGAGR